MDSIIELLFELIFEGAADGATSKGTPKVLRIILLIILSAICIGLAVVFTILAFSMEAIWAKVLLGIVAAAFVFLLVRTFVKALSNW